MKTVKLNISILDDTLYKLTSTWVIENKNHQQAHKPSDKPNNKINN